MNLMPIAQKLQDDGLGVMGETIFINMIPAEAPQGILLRNKLTGTEIDYELPGYYRAPFQLIVRAQSYADGESLTKQAFGSLTFANLTLDGMTFSRCRPKTLAAVFPLSKGNLLEFAADFDTVFTE